VQQPKPDLTFDAILGNDACPDASQHEGISCHLSMLSQTKDMRPATLPKRSIAKAVVSKNPCNSRFLPSRGIAVGVVDDTPQHRATTHGSRVSVGHLRSGNLLLEPLMRACSVEKRSVFTHHAVYMSLMDDQQHIQTRFAC
jgi:hypothetical protein